LNKGNEEIEKMMNSKRARYNLRMKMLVAECGRETEVRRQIQAKN